MYSDGFSTQVLPKAMHVADSHGRERQWRIPWSDQCGDAFGLARDVGQEAFVAVVCLARQGAGDLGKELEVARRASDLFDHSRHRQSRVHGFEIGQFLTVGAQAIANAIQNILALIEREARPRASVECFAGRSNGGIDLGGIGRLQHAERLLGGRIDDGKVARGRTRGYALAVDQAGHALHQRVTRSIAIRHGSFVRQQGRFRYLPLGAPMTLPSS